MNLPETTGGFIPEVAGVYLPETNRGFVPEDAGVHRSERAGYNNKKEKEKKTDRTQKETPRNHGLKSPKSVI